MADYLLNHPTPDREIVRRIAESGSRVKTRLLINLLKSRHPGLSELDDFDTAIDAPEDIAHDIAQLLTL